MLLINAHCHLYNHPEIDNILTDTNIANPLAINCRDGIYAVRAKTYECNDGRHKCRPYERDIITNVKVNCYNIYISTALTDDELEHHLEIKGIGYHKWHPYKTERLPSSPTNSNNFLLATGQHPMYPHGSINAERAISLCESNRIFAIGEIGLDKHNKDTQWQVDTFLTFADIANQYQKPVVIHCVGRYYEVYSLLKRYFPSLNVILHGFCGSVEIVQSFSELNTVFSIHRSILKRKNSISVLNAVVNTHRFMFETDTDDDISVLGTVVAVSELLGVPVEELLKIQEESFLTI